MSGTASKFYDRLSAANIAPDTMVDLLSNYFSSSQMEDFAAWLEGEGVGFEWSEEEEEEEVEEEEEEEEEEG